MGRGLKPQKWSPEEDEKLIRFVKEHEPGTWNWASLPEKAGLLRSAKSCNSRWNDYLRDDFKRGNYTKEEEETIVRLHQAFGNSWATIAQYLPGRSNIEIKNYWKHNLMKRVRWTSKADSTSKMVILPNLGNDEKKKDKSWAKELCTSVSTSTSTAGEELLGSITNLEKSVLEEVDVVNNSLAENGNLNYRGNNNDTVGEELGWSPTDFELYGLEEMGIFNNILVYDSNMNYRRDGGGSLECVNSWTAGPGGQLAWPTGSNWLGHEQRAMVNSILDENGNLIMEGYNRRSMGVAVGEMEQNSELVELFPEPLCSDVLQGDLVVNTPTRTVQGSFEVPDALMVSTPGLFYGDLGWHDSHFIDSSCGSLNEEGYFRGSMEVAVGELAWYPDPVRSDVPQGDMTVNMPSESVQETDEVAKNLMADLQDNGVGGHAGQPSDGLDLVYAMFADCL